MEVAYWQLVVILSVALTFLFGGRKAAVVVCFFWTLWTFAMVFTTALAMIQLASAWGSFLVCRSIADSWNEAASQRKNARSEQEYAEKQRKEAERQRREADRHRAEVSKLKSQLDSFLSKQDVSNTAADAARNLAEADPSSIQFISGAEHYTMLKNAIANAHDSLSVLSGWLGSPVLDPEIGRALEAALRRGVNVYIGFGWASSDGHTMSNTAKQAYEVLHSLAESSFSGRLVLSRFPNHEKVLAVDDAYVVIGSNNWLSNKNFSNSERSVVLKNADYAHQEHMRVMTLISKHASF